MSAPVPWSISMHFGDIEVIRWTCHFLEGPAEGPDHTIEGPTNIAVVTALHEHWQKTGVEGLLREMGDMRAPLVLAYSELDEHAEPVFGARTREDFLT